MQKWTCLLSGIFIQQAYPSKAQCHKCGALSEDRTYYTSKRVRDISLIVIVYVFPSHIRD